MRTSIVVTTNWQNLRYEFPWFESMSYLVGYIPKLLIKRIES